VSQAYGAFFCAGYATLYEYVWSFQLSVAYVATFDGYFFAVFADFEDAFVVFCALVVAHLPCTGN